jgi:predicted secreted protein
MTEIVLTETARGRATSAEVGDTIAVQLAENPTTGFRWQLDAIDRDVLEAIGDEFRPDPQSRVGGGGVRVFRFRARRRGTTNLEIKLARSWESGAPRAVFAVRLDLT